MKTFVRSALVSVLAIAAIFVAVPAASASPVNVTAYCSFKNVCTKAGVSVKAKPGVTVRSVVASNTRFSYSGSYGRTHYFHGRTRFVVGKVYRVVVAVTYKGRTFKVIERSRAVRSNKV